MEPMESYRIEAPEIPALAEPDSDALRYLDLPAAVAANSGRVACSYVFMLMPAVSFVGMVVVGFLSDGDACWLVLLPIAAYCVFASNRATASFPLLAVGALSLVFGVDAAHYLVPIVLLAQLGHDFAVHYLWLATVAPMRLARSIQLRRRFGQCRRTDLVLTGIVLGIGMGLAESPLPTYVTLQIVIAMSLPVLCVVWLLRWIMRPRISLTTYWEALRLWFGYNTNDVQSSGVTATPSGRAGQRVLRSCMVCFSLSVLAARPYADFPESYGSRVNLVANASAAHLDTDVERNRAVIATIVIVGLLLMIGGPVLLLFAGLFVFSSSLLPVAWRARHEVSDMSIEQQHEALMERLDECGKQWAEDHQ